MGRQFPPDVFCAILVHICNRGSSIPVCGRQVLHKLRFGVRCGGSAHIGGIPRKLHTAREFAGNDLAFPPEARPPCRPWVSTGPAKPPSGATLPNHWRSKTCHSEGTKKRGDMSKGI